MDGQVNGWSIPPPVPHQLDEIEEIYPFKSLSDHYKSMSFSTKAIHCGMGPDPSTGAVNPPIYMSSTFSMKNPEKWKGYSYTRSSNPGYKSAELQIAALEHAEHCLIFASGISAISCCALMAKPGDTLLCFTSCYSGTFNLLYNLLSDFKIKTLFVDVNDYDTLISSLTEFKPKLLFFESPTNPLMDCCDIKKVAHLAKENGCTTIFDNTFSTPYHLNPLTFGVDIVVHSSTKYLGGHSDMLSGVMATNDKDLYQQVSKHRSGYGFMPSPFDAWLLGRSVKSLKVRVQQHSDSAMKFSEYFSKHPLIKKVYYLGLPEHKDHKIALSQMKNGFGGMVSVDLNLANSKQIYAFFENLKLFTLGISLGGIESLVNHSVTMTHSGIPNLLKDHLGLTETFVRVSIGLEDIEDLIYDFEQALKIASELE